ncbi:S1 family peptidase [Mycobacterium shigaense]|uniref:S1 family peptidase n=1 Tax=Mycobacterium shigaense TaxID=722731 RepID=UPI002AE040E5|nr:serine protease [Mycobacterium shigaense]MEA1123897.1 serine protease [Mycobacterium shigaense]
MATQAHRFFSLIHDPGIAQLIGQPADAGKADAWPLAYFNLYLQKIGVQGGNTTALGRILEGMEQAGLLLRAGWWTKLAGVPMQGQLYISQGVRSAQAAGNLWLSEALGADLIIESYKAVTVAIGGNGKCGTGLVLDRTHLVTNKHVLMDVAGPDMEVTSPFAETQAPRGCHAVAHPTLDVAVIELQEVAESEGFPILPGMVFREPAWADDVYLLGYPRVPWMVGTDITLQRGEVVNPKIEVPPVRDDHTEALGIIPERGKAFLYSAIARPGNSGGPIIAHDGRVIGLVVEDSAAFQSTDPSQRTRPDFPTLASICREVRQFVTREAPDKPSHSEPAAAPFYRGIPAGEVVRAIEELSPAFEGRLEGIAILEDSAWKSS